ncbi:MAG: tRNA uridine-5-carboxymethylaminomethyl(34) synthesis GTPase MnmE [Myxococcota bacterium]
MPQRPVETDVIVAAATPWGRAALAVVRLSGPGLANVLDAWVRPHRDGPRVSGRTRRVDVLAEGQVIDDGVLVVGLAPATFTGEPTAELTVHGNPVLLERVLAAAVAAGARMARPGEFTRRAVLHGKLDLVQAEAVHQVIEAPTAVGARLARQGLEGALSKEYEGLRSRLVQVAAELEARLDYPGDDLALEDDETVLRELDEVRKRAGALAGTASAGSVLVHGARVALVGAVNAGKSSLFNALLGRRRALVHDVPGTTRDVLEVQTQIAGLAVTLLDTAGERATEDPVEAAGLALAQELIADVDALIVVVRARPEGPSEAEQQILARTSGQPRVVALNGVDRAGVRLHVPGVTTVVPTVALTGDGVDALGASLRRVLVRSEPAAGDLVVASARQRDCLRAVHHACEQAAEAMPFAGVAAAAECVLGALDELDAMTGADTREDVLDALFSRFCIGK